MNFSQNIISFLFGKKLFLNNINYVRFTFYLNIFLIKTKMNFYDASFSYVISFLYVILLPINVW